MRRLILAALLVLSLAVSAAACTSSSGASPSPSGGDTVSAAASTTDSPSSAPPSQAYAWQVVNNSDPCKSITDADLKNAFAQVAYIEKPDEPNPSDANGIYAERDCPFAVYGRDFTTNSEYGVTFVVATYGQDKSDDIWTIMSQGRLPVTGIGDGAFYSDQGYLIAHKGNVIVSVYGLGDINNPPTLSKETEAALLKLVLAHIPG